MTSSPAHPIQIKATREGFALVPDTEASFESIIEYLERRIEESRDFFLRRDMTLDLRGKPLRTDEILSVGRLLAERAGVRLTEVRVSEEISLFPEKPHVPATPPLPVETTAKQDSAVVIVRNTCRGGTRIVSDSDCLVLGDVNHGAEIVAAGDIFVFGRLRGVAHAGATGNRSAKIWALSIEPEQIRIADQRAASPRTVGKPVGGRYETAELHDEQIEVESKQS